MADPLLDYLYKRPLPRPFFKALPGSMRTLGYLTKNVLTSFEKRLGEPSRQLPGDQEFSGDPEGFRRMGREIYELSNRRIESVQSKAQRLLGFIGIIAPLLVGLLAYVLTGAPKHTGMTTVVLILGFGALSVVALIVATVGGLRCLTVSSFMSPFLPTVLSPPTGMYLLSRPFDEGRHYLDCANYNQVRADHLTDFLRAGQLYLAIAIGAGALAGVVAVVNAFVLSLHV